MSKRHAGKRTYAQLVWARNYLNLGLCPKEDVFVAVANALGVAHPQSRRKGYEVLGEFIRQFNPEPYAPKQRIPGGAWTSYRSRPTSRFSRKPLVAKSSTAFIISDAFLQSYEWRKVRMVVLKREGARCQCCGATPHDGVRMHVDHIQPRRTHPERALDATNLQVLCEVCNHGKGAWDDTDWRTSRTSQREMDTPVSEPVTATGRPRLVARGSQPTKELKKAVI